MSFINTYGGRGLGSLNKALANNMTIRQASDAAKREGFQFGELAQNKIDKHYNTFIGQYGGNTDANTTGMGAVQRAVNEGMIPLSIQNRAKNEGFTFGSAAQSYLDNAGAAKSQSYFEKEYGGRGMGAVQRALEDRLTVNQVIDQGKDQGFNFGELATNYLNQHKDGYIGTYGGNTFDSTAGLASVHRAMGSGMTADQVQSTGLGENITWGPAAQEYFDNLNQEKEDQKNLMADLNSRYAAQSEAMLNMQKNFSTQMNSIQNRMIDQQTGYQNNLTSMQNTLMAAQNPQTRESVLGVKGASADSSNTAKLNRQGLKGSFARTGLRINSLNI